MKRPVTLAAMRRPKKGEAFCLLLAVVMIAGCAIPYGRPRGAPTCCAVYLPPPLPPPPPLKELVVLRPDLDGKIGEVRVLSGDTDVQLHEPSAAAEVMADGTVRVSQVSEAAIEETFGESLAALPVPPRSLTLYFEFDSVDLVPESEQVLEELRAELKKRAVAEIVVVGHTDRSGPTGKNDRLSRERASAIRSWLIDQGVPAAAISTAGRGEREPMVQTEDGVEELKNRRVELRVR